MRYLTEPEYKEALEKILNTQEKKKLFREDAAFKSCIECIVRGQDPIDLLVSVCNMKMDLNRSLESLLMKMPMVALQI